MPRPEPEDAVRALTRRGSPYLPKVSPNTTCAAGGPSTTPRSHRARLVSPAFSASAWASPSSPAPRRRHFMRRRLDARRHSSAVMP
jgi:hypothetical protein